jgi:hypothetical protein
LRIVGFLSYWIFQALGLRSLIFPLYEERFL